MVIHLLPKGIINIYFLIFIKQYMPGYMYNQIVQKSFFLINKNRVSLIK